MDNERGEGSAGERMTPEKMTTKAEDGMRGTEAEDGKITAASATAEAREGSTTTVGHGLGPTPRTGEQGSWQSPPAVATGKHSTWRSLSPSPDEQRQQAASSLPPPPDASARPPTELGHWLTLGIGPSLATLSAQLVSSGLNCTERMANLSRQLVPSTRCPCPLGQMRLSNGHCANAPISTFRASLNSICGLEWEEREKDDALEEHLILLKLVSALPNQPVCVRELLEDEIIVLNTVCRGKCSVGLISKATSSRGNLTQLDVRIQELPGGACRQFDLNDCDEKADCLVHGLRYSCRCQLGTNDTAAEGEQAGRSCEGTVISHACAKVLGVCVLVWLLLLLLLCLLVPIFCYLCYKYCRPVRRIMETYLHRLEAKVGGEGTTSVPVIRTSSAPTGALRRESGVSLVTEDENKDTLRVPASLDGQKPFIPSVWHTHADSEDYLIVEVEGEDEEGAGGREGTGTEADEGPRTDGREEGKTGAEAEGQTGMGTRQQTEQSSSAGPGTGLATEKSEETIRSQSQSQGPTVQQTAVEVLAAEEESQGQPAKSREADQASLASRSGTPTIWDQFRILGEQYTRFSTIEERRESDNSMERLIGERAEGKDRAGREKQEMVKDELDAEQKMRGMREEESKKKEEEVEKGTLTRQERVDSATEREWARKEAEGGGPPMEGADKAGPSGIGQPNECEPGRSIPAHGLAAAGAVNIGFGFPLDEDAEIPRMTGFIRHPSMTMARTSRRQFVPKRMQERVQKDETGGRERIGLVLGKGPSRAGAAKDQFVLVRGRKVEEKVKTRGAEIKAAKKERMLRMKAQQSKQTMEEEDIGGEDSGPTKRAAIGLKGEMGTEPASLARRARAKRPVASVSRIPRHVPRPALPPLAEGSLINARGRTPPQKEWSFSSFDPDLPSSSKAKPRLTVSPTHGQRSLRQGKEAGKEQHSPEERRRRFREEGRAMASIEEQIEEKVHSGCITEGRKPWDTSPRLDFVDWHPHTHGRELVNREGEEGEGLMGSRSLERMEEKVHSGCITGRRPWDASPYREDWSQPIQLRRGRSEWDMGPRERREERRTAQSWLDLD